MCKRFNLTLPAVPSGFVLVSGVRHPFGEAASAGRCHHAERLRIQPPTPPVPVERVRHAHARGSREVRQPPTQRGERCRIRAASGGLVRRAEPRNPALHREPHRQRLQPRREVDVLVAVHMRGRAVPYALERVGLSVPLGPDGLATSARARPPDGGDLPRWKPGLWREQPPPEAGAGRTGASGTTRGANRHPTRAPRA